MIFQSRQIWSLNSTFVVLQPKKEGAEDLNDFRPISLIGNVYKLIAKHGGKTVLDASWLANEAIDSILSKKETAIFVNWTLRKPMNINWNFTLSMLQRMGFCEKWVGWIQWCISIASIFFN